MRFRHALVSLAVSAWAASCGRPAPPPAAQAPASSPTPPSAPAPAGPRSPRIGDTVVLRLSGDVGDQKDVRQTFVRAVKPESWADYRRFVRAGDDLGVARLQDARLTYMIDPGASCKVLDLDDFGYDLRVTDGRFAGSEFWVLRRNVDP